MVTKKAGSLGLISLVAVAGVIVGLMLSARFNITDEGKADSEIWHTLSGEAGAGGAVVDFTGVSEKALPAVVNIRAQRKVEDSPHANPNDRMREFFEKFFGRPMPAPKNPDRVSAGSGFIIHESGLVLTNNHVVQDATKVYVALENEKEYEAEVLGRDEPTDIALLKITVEGKLPTIPLGSSEALKIGEWVIAVGNPFGRFSQTVTHGIVSQKERPLGGQYDQFIQTDASINPGNSGGPLLNVRGEVIGINSAIYSQDRQNIGIGFAIPIDTVKALLPQLKDKGAVSRGWLGVQIQKVTPDLAETLGVEKGALVSEVFSGSPAMEAGIRQGDVIVEFADTPISDSSHLSREVALTPVGKEVPVKVIRDGDERTLDVVLAERTDEVLAAARDNRAPEVEGSSEQVSALGISVADLDDDLRERYGIDEDAEGVIVTAVDGGSAAYRAGMRERDIIVEVGHQEIASTDDFLESVNEVPEGDSILILVKREGTSLFMALRKTAD